MKKKVLPLAVSAAAAVTMSSAQAAMYINEKGTGETLIFPFYSAENGNNTLVNIVNTVDSSGLTVDNTGAWKAVKVRIIEAQNSQEVLDFNLYLSPKDHFSFAISATEDGGAQLTTGDNSCTVPTITGAIPFVNYEYLDDKYTQADRDEWMAEQDKTAEEADKAGKIVYDNTGLDRTQVGYIEVIEMGQIDPDDLSNDVWLELRTAATSTAANDGKPISVAASITHDSDGVPADCSLVNEAWSKIGGSPGKWLDDATSGAKGTTEMESDWLGGGLYGYATVINVPEGAAFGYDAVAVDDMVALNEGAALHYQPGSTQPNFADEAFDNEAIITNGGVSETLTITGYPDGIDELQALNATMMSATVMNDYVTDVAIAATTDWALTFPTKTYHVTGTVPVTPFSSSWDGRLAACEATNITMVDREESAPPIFTPGDTPPIFSPAPPSTPVTPESDNLPICYETTIVQFAEETAMGSSSVAVGVNARLEAEDGWATISFLPSDLFADGVELDPCGRTGDVKVWDDCPRWVEASASTGDTSVMTGLPVTGFAVQKYVNGAAGGAGVLANYAMSTEHKTTVALS
jgi:hypothetical protein